MGWMDFDDVRNRRGLRARDMHSVVDGSQAANDAARGVRSDKPSKRKGHKVKGFNGSAKRDLTASDIRKLESIARKRERGKELNGSEKLFLRTLGYKV